MTRPGILALWGNDGFVSQEMPVTFDVKQRLAVRLDPVPGTPVTTRRRHGPGGKTERGGKTGPGRIVTDSHYE